MICVDVDDPGVWLLVDYLLGGQVCSGTAGRLDKKVESNVTATEAGVH